MVSFLLRLEPIFIMGNPFTPNDVESPFNLLFAEFHVHGRFVPHVFYLSFLKFAMQFSGQNRNRSGVPFRRCCGLLPLQMHDGAV